MKLNRLIATTAVLAALGLCMVCTGCGSSKPPETSAPGTQHASGEQMDEKDASVVHESNNAGAQGAGAQPAGGK